MIARKQLNVTKRPKKTVKGLFHSEPETDLGLVTLNDSEAVLVPVILSPRLSDRV